MSKRLEEFERELDFMDDSADMEDYHRLIATLESLYADGELRWIYKYAKEQAEQVERLKVKNTKLKNQKRKFMDKATWQRKEKQRYREAFKQIKLQILFDGAIEDHRKNIIEIIDEALEESE